MSQQEYLSIPRLVALPAAISETQEWPELEQAMGRTLAELPVTDRQWLTISTLHRSALYEQSDQFPNISPVCLDLLESVGA